MRDRYLRLSGILGPAAIAVLLSAASRALADGFHNAALATKSLDQWLDDVQRAVPQLRGAFQGSDWRGGDIAAIRQRAKELAAGPSGKSAKGPRRTGLLEAEITPVQRQILSQKARDCLEVLAFLEADNIVPGEFPNFPMQRIGQYRQASKRLLHLMGREGTRMVASQLRAELMGNAMNPYGVPLHRDYHQEMLEILGLGLVRGDLTNEEIASLKQATEGAKPTPELAQLASQVRRGASLEDIDLATLLEAANGADAEGKRRIAALLRRKLAAASALDLLKIQDTIGDPQLQRLAAAEAEKKSVSSQEVEGQLQEYWRLANSANPQVATVAGQHVAAAFQQTKLSRCLYWIGEADPKLRALIWEQLDGRIQRADATRRSGYSDVALKVVEHPQYSLDSRKAGLELLARLKDGQAVQPLVAGLPQMPRELWPTAGAALKRITGQDFGPSEGDGIAGVVDAQKRWQAWLRQRGNQQ